MIPYPLTNVNRLNLDCKVLPNNILLKSMKSALKQFLNLRSHWFKSISFCVTEDPDLRSVIAHSGTVLNESYGQRIWSRISRWVQIGAGVRLCNIGCDGSAHRHQGISGLMRVWHRRPARLFAPRPIHTNAPEWEWGLPEVWLIC